MKVDWLFIETLEGFSLDFYVPNNRGVVIGVSGVTVGTGFDIGQRSYEDISAMPVSSNLKTKLYPFAGVRGQKALELLKSVDPEPLSCKEAEELKKVVYKEMEEKLSRFWQTSTKKSFSDLPSAVQTVLMSVFYQYGSLTRTPKLLNFAMRGNWGGVLAELKDFKDKFPVRRVREANYLEQNLSLDVA